MGTILAIVILFLFFYRVSTIETHTASSSLVSKFKSHRYSNVRH